jgi:preprotein translocase subunit SecG
MPTEVKWAISFLIAAGLIYVGWKWTPILVTLHILVCFVLVLVIMLQSGNAADLAGAFGGAGSQTAFGPRGAATFLSKATTWCAIVFMLTSLTLSIKRTPTEISTGGSSILEQTTKSAPAPAKPATPPSTPAPQQQSQPPAPQPQSQQPAPAQQPPPKK